VTDASSTDGRFLLHALALQFLSSRYSPSSSEIDDNMNISIEGAVLWISCAPVTEKQIMMGLRKGVQHNLGGGSTTGSVGGKSSSSNTSVGQGGTGGGIHIVSIPLELADAALCENSEGKFFSHEIYLKQLHKRIVHWLKHRELLPMQQSSSEQPQQSQEQQHSDEKTLGPNLIIIDNATTLGALFGDRLANAFVSGIRSSLKRHAKKTSSHSNKSSNSTSNTTIKTAITTINHLLAIRASSPDDGGLYQIDGSDGSMKGEKLRSEYSRLLRPWLGFGSGVSNNKDNDGAGANIPQLEEQSNDLSLSPHSVPSLLYTSGLYEIADGIVDVSPLESGYARDVLGRLSFATTWSGKGWWGIAAGSKGSGNAVKQEDVNGAYSSFCVNYRCDDSGVRVMRLRSR